jgi:hypothetical protein
VALASDIYFALAAGDSTIECGAALTKSATFSIYGLQYRESAFTDNEVHRAGVGK